MKKLRKGSSSLLEVEPVELDAGADLLSIARQYREDGIVPGDPDRVTAVGSPLPFDASFVADRTKALEEAAIKEHVARGGLATRELRREAKRWARRAARRERQLERNLGEVDSVADLLEAYNRHVRAMERREPTRAERTRYRLFQVAFAMGDIAGITNGAMQLGDAWPLALTQGIGIGVAGVSAGMVGGEIRRQRERANRPDEAPAGAEAFAHLFGPDEGVTHANVVLGIAGLAVGLIALGQFALRASLDGNVVGLVYAAFGAVMVAGSFVNSYIHDLDELANYREGLEERETELTAIVDDLVEPEAESAALTEEADRVEAAFLDRGHAVAALIRAEQLSIPIANPTTFGTHHTITTVDAEDEDKLDDDDELIDEVDLAGLEAEMQHIDTDPYANNSNGLNGSTP
jgi:hypothetical protein